MLLTLKHTISYDYSEPIAYAIQSLRLTPQPYDGVSPLRWSVRAARRELPSFVDGFGNLIHIHSINRPHESAVLTVAGTVETRDTGGLVRGVAEPLPASFYRRETPLTLADAAIAALAGGIIGKPVSIDGLLALMEAIGTRVEHRPSLAHASATAAEALQKGAGLCQDHAHVFIAACRRAGLPARYVSGYRWPGRSGADGAGTIGDEASHAWAEAFIDTVGWVGFDPACRTRPTEAYVRVAVGLDYYSAAPVRGIRRGSASEALAVSVRVTAETGEQ